MIHLEKTTHNQLEKLDRNLPIIIPIGATEAHDEFLPLYTDNLIAQTIAKEIAKRANIVYGIPIIQGHNSSVFDYQGTIGLSKETLQKVIEEICGAYISHGFKKLFLLNGHGMNKQSLEKAIEHLNKKFPNVKIKAAGWWNFCEEKVPHSGKIETEIALAIDPSIGNPKNSPHNPNIESAKKLYEEIIENITKEIKEKW